MVEVVTVSLLILQKTTRFFRQITRYSIGLFFHSLPAAGPPGGGLNNAQPALIRW